EVCRRLKAEKATRNIPIIFVTAMTEVADETKGLELGAIDYLTKPISPPIVKARVRNHLELKLAKEELENQNEILEIKVQERTREVALTQEVTIESMAILAETRDPETGGHIRRTQNYVRALAVHLKDHPKFTDFLNAASIDLLYKSAPLHDIGKVGVPDAILLKPGKLTDEEFVEMKKHTLYGRDSIKNAEKRLGDNSFLGFARDIAYTHHEKWDGSGYPVGLKGEGIPLCGRLMALADVYDALISKRVYKPPFDHGKAVAIITEGRGTHFDPDLVDAFITLEDEFRKIALEFADFEEERAALARKEA
ncbi:MAG: HD domain-containing protein, partial [Proteobacteria bacterium]|nr:HD domain-containing protein [Pseudomonadota bacterium]